MISTLIAILIIALVVYLAFWIIDRIGIGHPVNVILKVVVGVIGILALLNTITPII